MNEENSIKNFLYNRTQEISSVIILAWLVFLYISTTWLVLGSLSAIHFQNRVSDIKSGEDQTQSYSVNKLLDLTEKNYINKETRTKIVENFLKLHSQFNEIVNKAITNPAAKREKNADVMIKSSEEILKELTNFATIFQDSSIQMEKSSSEFKKFSTTLNNSSTVTESQIKEVINKINQLSKDYNDSLDKLKNESISSKNKSTFFTSLTNFVTTVNKVSEDEKEINKEVEELRKKISENLEETNKIYKEFQQSTIDSEDLTDGQKELLGELTYLRVLKFNYLAIMPAQLLTLILTLSMGALGSVIFITREFFGGTEKRRISWYLFRPFLGMVTAIAIFVLVKSGQLVISESKDGSAGAETLNPFFISFLAIISGVLSEQAYEKIHKTGESFLQTKDIEPARWAFRLKKLMEEQNKTREELAKFVKTDVAVLDKWLEESEAVPYKEQEIISAYLATPSREIFSDQSP